MHTQAHLIRLIAILGDHLLTHHLGHERRRRLNHRTCKQVPRQGRLHGLIVLCLIDIAQRQHSSEHIRAARQGSLRIRNRIHARRRFGQRGQHGRLRHRQLIQRFTEIHLCRRLDPVSAVAQKNLVQIERHDLLFTERMFDLDREQNLHQLAAIGFFATQEKIPRHLHRNRRATLPLVPGFDQLISGAKQTLQIDPTVGKKTVVFGRNKRIDHQFRQLRIGHREAALFTKLGNQPIIGVVHPHRNLVLNGGQIRHIRQLAVVNLIQDTHATDQKNQQKTKQIQNNFDKFHLIPICSQIHTTQVA